MYRLFEHEDFSNVAEEEREETARAWAAAYVRRPFDLARGGLLRAAVLRLAEDEHVAVVVMHYIVSDGWSQGVLIRELEALYAAFVDGRPSPLRELPVQYADYALWQRSWLKGEALEKQVGYWKARLAGAPPALALPTDSKRACSQEIPKRHYRSFCEFGLRMEIDRLSLSLSVPRPGWLPHIVISAASFV